MGVVLELVVGAAGDDVEFQSRQGLLIDDAAERAGREHVGIHVVDLLQRDRLGAEFVHHVLHAVWVDVAGEHLGAGLREELGQVVAHAADALHGEADLAWVVVTVFLQQAGLDALQGAEGGEGRRVAAAAVDPVDADHAVGLLVDVVHVVDGGADVLGGDVASAERADEAPEGAEQSLALVPGGIADQHCLAAAQVQPRHRRLVGHAARQSQHVLHGLVVARVRPHPKPAKRRPERRVMDRDNGLQTAVLVLEEHNLLVAHAVELLEEIHQGRPS